jgi:hypothetical protein
MVGIALANSGQKPSWVAKMLLCFGALRRTEADRGGQRRTKPSCSGRLSVKIAKRIGDVPRTNADKMPEGGTLNRYGRPHKIADAVAFLATESRPVHQRVIRVDGGRSAGRREIDKLLKHRSHSSCNPAR